MLEVTGVTTTASRLLGVDAQVVGVDVGVADQDVVAGALVDQAAQRQDRRQAGEVGGARRDAEVDRQAAGQGVAARSWKPEVKRLNW